MGIFFREKVLFYIVRPPFFFLLGSFFCLFVSFRLLPVSLSLFVLFLFLPFLLFAYLLAYLLAFLLVLLRASFLLLFLLLISPFSHSHPFSSLLYTAVHCSCLRCGRELQSIGKLRCRAGIDAVCKKGAERVIPFLCPLRIFHQPDILLPAPRAPEYHIYCQSSFLCFSQRLLQCRGPGSL